MSTDFDLEFGDYNLSISSDENSSLLEDVLSGSWEISGGFDSDGDWHVELSVGD